MKNSQEIEQYYTPEISELFIGYECEKESYNNEEEWSYYKLDFSYGWCEIPEGYNKRLRTPYLTKQQIIEEGWKMHGVTSVFIKDKYELFFNNYKNIDLHYYDKDKDWKKIVLYNGECKSINEFRKILLYLSLNENR